MDQWSVQLAPQLRALVALAGADGYMTQAAADLDIPQSSMSRRINALQAALRVPLLIHDGRRVRLTPAAHRLATHARGPLEELDRILAEVTGEADPDHGTVRFGFPLTMGSGRIPDLLAAFRHRHPGIRVQLKQDHGSELVSDLTSGELDLAVVIPAPQHVRHTVVGSQRIYVALPEGHHLAGEVELDLAALEDETFIANPPSYNLRQVTETWCLEAGYVPDIAIEVTEFATIRELVARNLGIALLPRDDRTPPGVVEVEIAGTQFTRTIALAWGTAQQAAPTRSLNDYLLRHFDEGGGR